MEHNWNGRPYHSLDWELKHTFGHKVYKLSLDAGLTCPNRDGTLGTRGCIFCSEGGSGDFAENLQTDVWDQIEAAKKHVSNKTGSDKNINYIAYFQSFTNTYGPVDYLRSIFTEAIQHPEIEVLAIATRPDCLQDEIVSLLSELNQIKPVWVELGLQTMHEDTAQFIRRGYPLPVFEDAVKKLRLHGIEVITHVILGLPGEDHERMLETIRYLNTQDIQGIKLQLLHILKGTDLADIYEHDPFPVFTLEEYVSFIVDCVEIIRPDMVIHRLTGDGPKDLLIAPLWSSAKRHVLNSIHREFRLRDTWQGKYYDSEGKEQ